MKIKYRFLSLMSVELDAPAYPPLPISMDSA